MGAVCNASNLGYAPSVLYRFGLVSMTGGTVTPPPPSFQPVPISKRRRHGRAALTIAESRGDRKKAMATDRWHPPTQVYSSSIRGQPTSPNLRSDIPVPVHPDLIDRIRSTSPTHTAASILLQSEPHQQSLLDTPTCPSHDQDHISITSPTAQKRTLSLQDDQSRKQAKITPQSLPPGTIISDQDPVPTPAFTSSATPDLGADVPIKPKSTRVSRACTVCRKLKMRCVDAENGPPCKRCRLGNHQCVFEESQRGKKGTKRTDLLARNLQSVEQKLDAVMSQIQTKSVGPLINSPQNTSLHGSFDISSETPKPSSPFNTLGSSINNGSKNPLTSCLLRSNPGSAILPDHGDRHWNDDSTDQPPFQQTVQDLGLPSVGNSSSRAPRVTGSGTSASHSSASTPLVPESNASRQFVPPLTDSRPHQALAHVSPSQSHNGHSNEHGHTLPLNRFAALPDFSRPSSPRLHSLPDNTLNPLGLLAEASLRNRHDRHRSDHSSSGSHRRTSSTRSIPSHQRTRVGLEQSDATREHISEELNALDDASSESSSTSSFQEPCPDLAHDTNSHHHHHANKSHKRKVGVANQSYFQPAPRHIFPLRRIVIEKRIQPSLLTDKILSNEEAVELFQIFFDKCNPHCCILEREFHTPTIVGSRSPFLFTVICAVASRYYEKRQELHLNCLQTARRIAFDVMVKGYKSVEVVQAFLLLSLWNQPAERFEEDRTWAFSGIAIRMAIDLNLHRKTTAQLPLADPPTNQMDDGPTILQQQEMNYEKEILNRERTWLFCFILDRSLSAQMGKPYSIREDFIIRASKTWHRHRCSVLDDSGVTAMVDLHRIHSRILDTLYSDTCSNSGLNANLDYSLLMKTFSQSLDQWMTECNVRARDSPHDRPGGYRHSMKEFYYNYYRLFTMSFMLQHTLENPDKQIELPQVYLTCYDAATRVITIARDHLGPMGALRYAPDNQFVYIAYAAVFLLKLIRPQFCMTCDVLAVRNLVHDCTVLLEEVSVDETHTPALYAAFLKVLLKSKKETSSSPKAAEASEPPVPPSSRNSSVGYQNGTGVRCSKRLAEQDQQNGDWSLQQLTSNDDDPTSGSLPGSYALDHPIPNLSTFQSGPTTANTTTTTTTTPPLGPSSMVVQPPPELHTPELLGTDGGVGVGVGGPPPFGFALFEPQSFEGLISENCQHPSQQQPLMDDYFVDSLLRDGGFWDSMLMPGYSGPLDALSGGVGLVSQFNTHDPNGFTFTPTASGRATPNMINYNALNGHVNGSEQP